MILCKEMTYDKAHLSAIYNEIVKDATRADFPGALCLEHNANEHSRGGPA